VTDKDNSGLAVPTADASTMSQPPRRRVGQLEILTAILLALLLGQRWLVGAFTAPVIQTWATVFVAIVVQATPFLVLGVALSAAIAAFVPSSVIARALPRRDAFAVPVAGLSGMVLPGCECASVPVAGSLVARGIAPAAALTFLLAAPAINPIVLVATAVAFPGRPEVVGARFAASLTTALVMGWLWARFGRTEWIRMRRPVFDEAAGRWTVFRAAMQHDFLHAGGFLVVGSMVAATVNVIVPRDWVQAVADNPVLAVLALAGLAVIVAICSEADAFVAASFSEFSPAATLAFMVVGPAVDVKLIALQSGTFGRAFAVRFAPTTFLVAVTTSVIAAWWLL